MASLETETKEGVREALTDIQRMLRDYIVVGEAERTFLAHWCLHTFLLDHVRVTPYIAILSPTMRSGKTRLLEILELVTCRGWLVSDVSAAVVFRKVHDERVTLIMDEADCQLMGRQLLSLLNTGYKATGRTVRLDRKGVAVEFSTFCAKVFAGIGSPLPPTVMDRSVPVMLKRKLPSERVLTFRHKDVEARVGRIQAAFRQFERVFGAQIAEADPSMPEGLSDRHREGLESMFAIADLARTRTQLAKAVGTILKPGMTLDPLAALLTDVQAAFKLLNLDKVGTDRLLATMRNLLTPVYDGPATAGPMTLAGALRPLGINPRQLWIDGHNVKGYERKDFADAWQRYC